MSASLSDMLTAVKALVTATNNLHDNRQTSATVTTSTLIFAGSGVLLNCSVTVAGSTAATIYNSPTTAGAAAGNALVVIPAALGVTVCNLRFTRGLVVTPGSGQSINVTYTTG